MGTMPVLGARIAKNQTPKNPNPTNRLRPFDDEPFPARGPAMPRHKAATVRPTNAPTTAA
jgi:hypothetical protein